MDAYRFIELAGTLPWTANGPQVDAISIEDPDVLLLELDGIDVALGIDLDVPYLREHILRLARLLPNRQVLNDVNFGVREQGLSRILDDKDAVLLCDRASPFERLAPARHDSQRTQEGNYDSKNP